MNLTISPRCDECLVWLGSEDAHLFLSGHLSQRMSVSGGIRLDFPSVFTGKVMIQFLT